MHSESSRYTRKAAFKKLGGGPGKAGSPDADFRGGPLPRSQTKAEMDMTEKRGRKGPGRYWP